MKQERRSGRWSGKQIAFIGVLFGVAQGSFEKSCEKMARDQKGREWAADVLADANRKFLRKVQPGDGADREQASDLRSACLPSCIFSAWLPQRARGS